jgi:membrane protein YdbS with pleckstrin-like domain
MNQRARKFIGAAIMVAFVLIYALIAMALAQSKPVQEASSLIQALYYVVIGLAWIIPLMPLIKWMEDQKPQG